MKTKPTQKEVVRQMLTNSQTVCGSNVYKETKRQCGVGSTNIHKQIGALKKDGYVINFKWCGEGVHRYKEHTLDFKKTPKKLLQDKSN
jgi:hypothetical protein